MKKVKTIEIDLNNLILDSRNARKHTKSNVEAIKASLLKFGQQKPIIINSENIVIAGNSTVVSAKELGWEKINAIVSDLTEDSLRAYSIADNKTCDLSDWDYVTLVEILEELREDGAVLEATGFSVDDIETYKGVDEWDGGDPIDGELDKFAETLTAKKISIEGNVKMFFENTLRKLEHDKKVKFDPESALVEICQGYMDHYSLDVEEEE